MFKTSLKSYAEMRACIKSLTNMRVSNVLPVLLCQDCKLQDQVILVKSRQMCSISNQSNSKSNRISSKDFTHQSLIGGCKHLKRHFFSSTSRLNPSEKPPEGSTNIATKVVGSPAQPQASPLNQSQQIMDNLPEAGTSVTDNAETTSTEDRKKNKVLSVIPRMRKPNPIDYSYTGNIYILPSRAMMEYLLRPSDLTDLPKYTRRSPYESGTRITLYLRTDVEEVALKKWGDFDKLNKEKAKLRNVHDLKFYDITDLRRLLGEMHSSSNSEELTANTSMDGSSPPVDQSEPTFWKSGSARVILSAVFVNGANTLFKLIAWLYTGSHSMFSEFVHSCADTMNQIILGFGLYHSHKKPDTDHPYGYRNLRHISSLISGVGIFFFGTGLSYYHSFQGFINPLELGNLTWCLATLFGSLISEGASLIIAINQVRKSAKALEIGFKDYLMRGIDPNVNVVLLEDLAAVLGVGIAGVCIGITAVTGSPFADAMGSALIGTLLGSVAAFIVHQNTHQLVGRSIPESERQEISQLLERDRMIRSLHDIKATEMGGVVRYKAEVDFDGKEITRAYLYKQDLELMLSEAQNLKTVEELETFMMNHGEKIIDALGAEVDRIEKLLKNKHPEVRHVDLEAL
ncbi:proton-coupled zinc antiporter SLC30A9, mitochondrial-like [Biomphalaria glabrata]|uniref:Proton-coupled zinc antiporter SLC30A9, mitochondrial n=1 Tax=Biomphalaria glabrata TaxID=6526 RepID=A0A9W3B3B0_BIOGL|nr:proton-coupled zinc antiporter SLC30A9, mitochondrial-like [Biomphalaria glabrata]XP_013077283.2 proton-coupled zinc antiporter SLC30A9, mitochondrial-like [Biomphalaria glabrata]XP_055893962.1 proton-coupled zinc antiporter SLC30A9, mitochondrial-like [Biomphalaria glabrata]XP_055893963.1 proton-coupled zinc antiporter SLC30A9, mitochondrial-like [Biomphalaria glabrata]KAI8797910.1 zinc transporter 9 [Biomphalaria glabrata]